MPNRSGGSTYIETFLDAMKYPGFQLTSDGEILWTNSAGARELDISSARSLFELVQPQDQPIVVDLLGSRPGSEHEADIKILVENHTFAPVVLHLDIHPNGQIFCVMTPRSPEAARTIGSQQTKILEALCSLPMDSLIRTLAHSLRRWTQCDLVVFVKAPEPMQSIRVLSCSFSSAVNNPRLILEYLRRRLPRGGVQSLAHACASSFGFANTLIEDIQAPDGTTWGHLLHFEVRRFAIQSVRRLMVRHVAQAAQSALGHHPHKVLPPPDAIRTKSTTPHPANQAGLRATICSLSKEKQALINAKAAAELSASQQHNLLANISHEIRTPLNGIAGIVSLLECTELSDTQKTYVSALVRSVESMTRIINDCFDLSGLRAESFKLKVEPTALVPFLREVCLGHGLRINEKGLRFFAQLPLFKDVLVMADRVRLRQIVDNLMTNAIKFTTAGSITLGLRTQNQRAIISLHDTGRGIDPSNLEKVFNRFFQEMQSNDVHCSGLGIGLTISRQLVELMNGSISAQASSESGGSVFEVSFPIHAERMRHSGYLASLQQEVIFVVVTLDRKLATVALEARQEGLAVCHLEPGQTWNSSAVCEVFGVRAAEASFVLVLDNLPTAIELAVGAQFPKGTRQIRLRHHVAVSPQETNEIGEPFAWDDIFAALRPAGRPFDGSESLAPPGHDPVLDKSGFDGALEVPFAAAAKPRVLLAEDDDVNQFVLRQFLDKLGFSVDVAPNGAEALALLETDPLAHDIHIFDCMMPQMDGLELTRRIRSREASLGESRRTLIALTADAMKGREERCLAAGFDVFLTKPIQIAQLRKTLRDIMDTRPRSHAARPGIAAELA
jgi:signal transduction histidine kinase/CheY-like chemotaxis protein